MAERFYFENMVLYFVLKTGEKFTGKVTEHNRDQGEHFFVQVIDSLGRPGMKIILPISSISYMSRVEAVGAVEGVEAVEAGKDPGAEAQKNAGQMSQAAGLSMAGASNGTTGKKTQRDRAKEVDEF